MEKSFFDVAASSAGKRRQGRPLKYTWKLWFSKKVPRQRFAEYAENLRSVGSFKTIEQFWRYYAHMKKAGDLEACNVQIFKDGIQPMWEDDHNKRGGKFMVRLKKGLAARCWENILFAIIGDQFDASDDICGAVLAVRPHEDIISVWHSDGDNTRAKADIEETLQRVLDLGKDVKITYMRHDVILSTVKPDKPPNTAGGHHSPQTHPQHQPNHQPHQQSQQKQQQHSRQPFLRHAHPAAFHHPSHQPRRSATNSTS